MILPQINTDMDKNSTDLTPATEEVKKKPDEIGGIHVEAFIKIFDPNTNETLLEARA